MFKIDDFSEHTSATDRIERLRLERHEFIKMQLRLSQSSLAEIGRVLGLKSGTITTVSKGLGQSRRVQLEIAKTISVPAWELWPERFTKDKEGSL